MNSILLREFHRDIYDCLQWSTGAPTLCSGPEIPDALFNKADALMTETQTKLLPRLGTPGRLITELPEQFWYYRLV